MTNQRPADGPIHVLHLEDDPADAELVHRALRAELPEAEVTLVADRASYAEALQRRDWDIVLSDYTVPGFGGLLAAELLRRRSADVPFILVTGTIGDEGAAAALRAGVSDYVLKDRLQRLGSAVRRALEVVRERRQRRKLEEQLRQAQKMEAVGQLTGGIAHDFNNILTIMMTGAELVALELRPDQAALREDVDALLAAGERGRDMVRKLLGFSRRQPIEPRAIDVAGLLTPLASTLRRLLPASIGIAVHVAPDAPVIRGDAGSLEQMILNLATNARDAMPDGGTLEITAGLAASGDPGLERHAAQGGPFARIAVRDTGVGMGEEVLRRVFEPFFTTKPPERGTGLGMAMVYGLAQQQHGFVDIVSEVGRGTTVALYLPVAPAGERPAARSESASAAGVREGDLLLIADDEPVLRRAMERLLKLRGYRVVTAANGVDALRLLIAHHNELALVVTDQMMPGFGGADVLREARARGLSVPFLITSGYAADDAEGSVFDAEVPRLLKPWTAEELVRAVTAAARHPGGR